MNETRKLVAILVADVVGYSRLASADEDRTLARLRGLRSDLVDPAIAAHHGRIVKRTGDGSIIEFRSAVDAVRCAVEVQNGLIERNAGLPEDRRIQFRVGIHVGEVVEESDGDLMGDAVNIAARLEGFAKPGAICLSEDAYRQVKQRLDFKVSDLGPIQLKNIAEPMRIYSLEVGHPARVQRAGLNLDLKNVRLAPILVAGILSLFFVALFFINISMHSYYLDDGKRSFANGHPLEVVRAYARLGELTEEAQVLLIASYIEAGLDTEARTEAQALLKRSPKFSVNGFLQQTKDNTINAGSDRLKRALIAAGLPKEVGWECLMRDICH